MFGGFATLQSVGVAAFPGFTLRHLARTPSTQDVVRAAARGGAAEGFCCVAGEQSAGRGRQGRTWVAPPGSALLASILLRPPAPAAAGVSLACGLAVADAVEALGAPGCLLKWPNDVLGPQGGKLAGILAEVEPLATGGLAVVCGVGLNLGVEAFPAEIAGASLHRLVGRHVGWEEALAELVRALGRRTAELYGGGMAATVAAWRARSGGFLGSRVAVATPGGGRVEGIAVDLADDGALLVAAAPDGEVRRLLAGDVHLLPPVQPGEVSRP